MKIKLEESQRGILVKITKKAYKTTDTYYELWSIEPQSKHSFKAVIRKDNLFLTVGLSSLDRGR